MRVFAIITSTQHVSLLQCAHCGMPQQCRFLLRQNTNGGLRIDACIDRHRVENPKHLSPAPDPYKPGLSPCGKPWTPTQEYHTLLPRTHIRLSPVTPGYLATEGAVHGVMGSRNLALLEGHEISKPFTLE